MCRAGESLFAKTPNQYISGFNDLGKFPDISVNDCALRCLQLAACRSFDAGTVGTSRAGNCFLSSQTKTALPASTRSSQVLDYYDRNL